MDNYIVSFTSSTFAIHDHLSRILYYFKDVALTKLNAVTCPDSKELWHQKLGHPLGFVICFLSHVSN